MIEPVEHADDPRLDDYRHVGDHDWLRARGLFVAEGRLVLRRLLPMAHEGLETWGVSADVRDRLLGIIEQRCLQGTNGAEHKRRWNEGRRLPNGARSLTARDA